MDKFEAMRTFVAVVDAGSFVGAAERLQSSKAVVSRLVAELEQHLGVRVSFPFKLTVNNRVSC